MKGLKLCEEYFNEYGKPMLQKDFAEYLGRIAVGLVGHGSECFGYDDEVSRDHDFEAGFCIWLTEEDEREFGFKLYRAYSKLPKEYRGVKIANSSVGGSSFKGVKTIKEFYSFYTGSGQVPTTPKEWLAIPDFYLREATNGKVFFDNLGEFTRIREELKNRPIDVRNKKLASCVFSMAQSGQYNYNRCISHCELGASGLALNEFIKSTLDALYLLNNEYAPYYKWIFRGVDELKKLREVKDDLLELMQSPFEYEKNKELIEKIAVKVASEIRNQGLSTREESYLEGYAYCINNKIADGELRNMPIML